MVDVKSARDAFMQLYADLTEVLPMNQPQLKAELYTKNLLPVITRLNSTH